MFDTPVLPRLETILAEVKSGDLLIPDFQRDFVWDDDRRLNLLDSIAKGLPIGSLLVWRTSPRDLETYPSLGGVTLPRSTEGRDKVNYLIDGHQRISTLFGALYPGARSNEKEERKWLLYYALGDSTRPAFRLPPRQAPPDTWLPLNFLLDGDRLFEFTKELREKGLKDQAKEAERLANLFKDYIIPIVPLVSEDLDVATDAFVRINSQGMKMSESHMLRALTYRKNTDTDKSFEDILARLEPLGWKDLEKQVLVNALKAMLGLALYGSGVRDLNSRLQEDPKALVRLSTAVYDAVKFLCSIGVNGPKALPYAYQLVTLAALAERNHTWLKEEKNRTTLRHWFWRSTYTEYFTGASGSQIREGIEQLENTLKAGTALVKPPTDRIQPLRRYRTSTVRTMAFLLFMAHLPKDISARERRLEQLGLDPSQTTPRFFPKFPAGNPANHVIAAPHELRELREAIKDQRLTDDNTSEWAIPLEALRKLPDEQAFLTARRAWLDEQECLFVKEFGLELERGTGEMSQEILDMEPD